MGMVPEEAQLNEMIHLMYADEASQKIVKATETLEKILESADLEDDAYETLAELKFELENLGPVLEFVQSVKAELKSVGKFQEIIEEIREKGR